MYEIEVEGRFSAVHRHRLPARDRGGVGGGADDTPPRHGHDFKVVARVRGSDLTDDVLVDFHQVESELARVLAELTHRDLGEETPASLARLIHDRLRERVHALASIEVRDTDRTGARFEPG